MSPARFRGECRTVEISAGFEWLRHGWLMFAAHPAVWIGCSIVMLTVMLAVNIVPLLGQLAVNVLLPVLVAGLLQLCRDLGDDTPGNISALFAGFRHNASALITVGAIYTAGIFGIAFLAFLLVSGGVIGGVITGRVGGFGIALGSMMLAALLVFALSVPVILAAWFAPALVYFHDMAPFDAMKASFAAGVKNWAAMVVFALLLSIGAFFALLPLGLGMLVFLPIVAGAVYASYRDLFIES